MTNLLSPIVCFGHVRVDISETPERWITTTTDSWGFSMTAGSVREPSVQALHEIAGIHRRFSAGWMRRN